MTRPPPPPPRVPVAYLALELPQRLRPGPAGRSRRGFLLGEREARREVSTARGRRLFLQERRGGEGRWAARISHRLTRADPTRCPTLTSDSESVRSGSASGSSTLRLAPALASIVAAKKHATSGVPALRSGRKRRKLRKCSRPRAPPAAAPEALWRGGAALRSLNRLVVGGGGMAGQGGEQQCAPPPQVARQPPGREAPVGWAPSSS